MGVPLPRGLTYQDTTVWEAAPLHPSLRGREVTARVEKKPLEDVRRSRDRQETGKYAVSENHLEGGFSHPHHCIMEYLFIHQFHSVGIRFMTSGQRSTGCRSTAAPSISPLMDLQCWITSEAKLDLGLSLLLNVGLTLKHQLILLPSQKLR